MYNAVMTLAPVSQERLSLPPLIDGEGRGSDLSFRSITMPALARIP
jgi:hypothetical protein